MRAEIDWQPSLFDGGPVALDGDYGAMRRIVLDERSWVDYCPGWLSGSDVVFAELAAQARWQQRTVHIYDRRVLEPRLTAGWSTDADDHETPSVLREMTHALSARYPVEFDRIWVNLYRDGADSVAWHGDRNRLVMTAPMVATVSLGARRKFLLRPRGTTRSLHRLEPGHGDLVVMGGACQAEWEHTVPDGTAGRPADVGDDPALAARPRSALAQRAGVHRTRPRLVARLRLVSSGGRGRRSR